MAYSPTLWKRGDIITAEKLNKVETGLQAAASVDIQSAQATALTPTNAQLPYAVGDIVLDATTKKLYAVTAASGGTCSIGTALATLP